LAIAPGAESVTGQASNTIFPVFYVKKNAILISGSIMLAKLKKFTRVCFRIGNVVVMLLYLLACLVPFISAGSSWFIAMMGLLFPLLFCGLFGFLVYWTFKRSKWAIACLAVLLFGWKQVSVMMGFNMPKNFKTAKDPGTLRVLTWNLSAWGQSSASDKSDKEEQMIDLIKKTNADVLCFEEYIYFRNKQVQDSIHPALRESGYRYRYFVRTKHIEQVYKSTRLITTIIISKYPIVDTGHLFYSDEQLVEPQIQADINVNGQVVRIFTTHLESVRFERTDFQALSNLKKPVNASLGSSRLIAYKLRNSYRARAAQAEVLNKKIKESPHPVIVCGDFNDVPNSYTYFTVKGDLQDAFLKKGAGFGRTLRLLSPTLRIDYIFADRKFKVKQCSVIEAHYSDHYPVIADLELPKP
jgi:endonuclease/exonuclease/phosphatase family metal-dependent hydrolase